MTLTALAWCLGTAPNVIEPALHNNHRWYFHSFAFAGVLGHWMYNLIQWETKTDGQKLAKTVGLISAGAYRTWSIWQWMRQ